MPRRARECRSAGAESPESAKGLGSAGTPPCAGPDRGRPRSVPLHPCTSLSLLLRVGMCLLSPCPGPAGGTAASPQPPGPGSSSATPPCRCSSPDAHLLECPEGEARRSSQGPAALDPSALPHVVPTRLVNCPTLFTDGLLCQ